MGITGPYIENIWEYGAENIATCEKVPEKPRKLLNKELRNW